jgi:histidinol-phosphate/aromatic aminotransferase/cobyric acid decarboxylase-like protein
MKMNSTQRRDLLDRGFSRRDFGRIAALIAGAGALPFFNEASLAQLSAVTGGIPAGAVKIDANENPLGPCPEAIEAVRSIAANGGRYQYSLTDEFVSTLAQQEGVKAECVRAYPGSSAPLHHAVIAFTSPTKPLVIADPGYEAGERAARFIGAKVIRVPLTKSCAHDVKAMAAASADAGIIYVCNPNNPTGTITPREQIDWLIDNKPKGAVVLLDEAYTHIAGEPMCSDQVAKGKDLIILRTFSKIYGMAGLRAGAAIGRPDLPQKFGEYMAGALPTTAMAAATASLKSKDLVEQRRKIIGGVRDDTLVFLKKRGYDVTPAVSNCFMVDVKRPGNEVITALRRENVYIGRIWPSWPTHVRVTVGTADEMEKFKAAFAKVMA